MVITKSEHAFKRKEKGWVPKASIAPHDPPEDMLENHAVEARVSGVARYCRKVIDGVQCVAKKAKRKKNDSI